MAIGKKAAEEQFSEVSENHRDAQDAYMYRRQAKEFMHSSFVRGWQHSRVDPYGTEIDELDEDEAVETHNIIRPVHRAAIASSLRQLPSVEIAANSADPRAQVRAESVERACKAVSHNGVIDWEEVLRAVSWAHTAGLGWIKMVWNPDAGRKVRSVDGQPVEPVGEDPFGYPIFEQRYDGELETQFVPSCDALPNPDARCFREIRYISHVRLLPEDVLMDRFPEDYYGKEIKGFDTGALHDAQQEFRWLQQEGWSDRGARGELAELVEYWEMPTNKYPNGRYALFSGDVLIHIGPNWLEPKRIPFVPFYGANQNPGSLYPDGVVADLISPQVSINRGYSKMREHIDKINNVHVLVPNLSGIDTNTWSDKPGSIIKYARGFPPTFVNPPQIGADMFRWVGELKDSSSLLSGYGDYARGYQGNVSSGRQLLIAHEKEQATREPDMIMMRKSFYMLYEQILMGMQQFYDDGRMMKVMGPDGAWEQQEFSAEDFDILDDVVPEIYSAAPTSPAVKFTETIELMSAGVLSDTPEAERARDMLGDRHYQKRTFDPFAVDRAKARRENLSIQRMVGGIVVAEFDDHPTHIKEHNQFRKTVVYEQLPPWLQQQIDEHVGDHEENLQAQQMLAGEQQQMMAGSESGTPNPATAPPAPQGPMEGMPSPFNGGHQSYPEPLQPVELTPETN